VLDPPGEGAPFDLVLLDRDGTINVRIPDGYVTRPDELRLLPGAAAAVGALTAAGCRTVLVTNQRGVARGLLDRSDLEAVHERLSHALAAEGGRLDAIAVCPHDTGVCSCRKPLDGLFRAALAAAPWAHPERCVMVGDMPSDLAPAQGLGMRTERVTTQRDLADVVALLAPPSGARRAAGGVRRGEGHVP
jgi:D-glycero-D-manno-heptose 1,7-bisphosphate phosphatase